MQTASFRGACTSAAAILGGRPRRAGAKLHLRRERSWAALRGFMAALATTSLKSNADCEATLLVLLAAAARTPIIPADALEGIIVGLVHQVGSGIVQNLFSTTLVFLAEPMPTR